MAGSGLEAGKAPSEQFQARLEEAAGHFADSRPPPGEQELAVYEDDLRQLYGTPAHRPAGIPMENLLLRESLLAPLARCLEDLVSVAGATRPGHEPRAKDATLAAEVAARCAIITSTAETYYSSRERPERARKAAATAGNRAGTAAVRQQLAWLAPA